MPSFEQRVIGLFETLHPLDRIARAGFVLRGVCEPESVAAHSHFVSLLALLFADRYPDEFDRGKLLAMALTHDLPEALLTDIPMPAADAHFGDAKNKAEQAIAERLLDGLDRRYAELHREFAAASSPEARLLRGLDKAQMMIKVIMYEREGRGRLTEFWANPRNFEDYGIEAVARLFDAICTEAGKLRPARRG